MAKLWEGRTDGATDPLADELNASIGVDSRLYAEDILGSVAHARMLGKQKIISCDEAAAIISGLEGILRDIRDGSLPIDMSSEDIHTFVEQELTERIGDAGKRLHTARSRNDQVALDERLYMRNAAEELESLVSDLVEVLVLQAEENGDAILPGYTHLQRAQPVLFGQHLLAYAEMFLRDIGRLRDTVKRMNISPIGACALAGTTYDTDRYYEAKILGFEAPSANSMDSVSDRDFALELLSSLSILQMHMSRMAEELVLWSSWEFKFIELSDAYTTGSSIMPQKKNPDMAELIRGKTGRVYGDLMTLLTVMKGLPLAYNKDMQEDKEPVFDAIDTVKVCLQVLAPMLGHMNVNRENMLNAAKRGFINATDLADYLTKKGMPFRTAYKITGKIVMACIDEGAVLEDWPIEKYKTYSELFGEDLYEAIDLRTCVNTRISKGGTSPASVKAQIEAIRETLGRQN